MGKVGIIGVGQSTFVRTYEGSVRELAFEGERFYDLMRLGWIHKFNTFVSQADEENGGGFWPIHDEAFLQNPEMTQNSFWE